jgi:hypothetical protein
MEARKGRNVEDYKFSSISKLVISDSTNTPTLRIIHLAPSLADRKQLSLSTTIIQVTRDGSFRISIKIGCRAASQAGRAINWASGSMSYSVSTHLPLSWNVKGIETTSGDFRHPNYIHPRWYSTTSQTICLSGIACPRRCHWGRPQYPSPRWFDHFYSRPSYTRMASPTSRELTLRSAVWIPCVMMLLSTSELCVWKEVYRRRWTFILAFLIASGKSFRGSQPAKSLFVIGWQDSGGY